MKTLYESLLDDFDLDDNIEINDQLFTYIRDISDAGVYDVAMNYLKDNSKLLSRDDRYDWRHVLHNHDVCFLILNKDPKIQSSICICIGEIGPNKCTILYFNDKAKIVGSMPLNTHITGFLVDKAYENEPCYVITNKKLVNGFKKMKF
jgi:hypothetical protein